MENNNGKGIFYGVIGVATLIVAIIGATFAYFSATTASTEYVQGAAATASLGVHVDRLTSYSKGEGSGESFTPSFVMVPQLDAGIAKAITGTTVSGVTAADNSTACIDDNGSLVCSIYKITVQNTGSAAINVSADLKFYGTSELKDNDWSPVDQPEAGKVSQATTPNKLNHLKWARLADPAALTTAMADNKYTFDELDAIKDKPTALLDYKAYATKDDDKGYAGNGIYQTLADNTTFAFANYTDPNVYLYGMDVTVPALTEAPFKDLATDEAKTAARNTWIDLLGGTNSVKPTEIWSHGAYTDLIDPTTDLKLGADGSSYVKNDADSVGQWHLAAKDQTGDTKVFYIVVWISENLQKQNDVDFGQFTGQVTFQSAGGSGATSSFTETWATNYTIGD